MKKLALQEKIDRAKPGDTIRHVVEDPNPLVLMEKPTVTRGWVEKWADVFYNSGISEQTGETVRWLKARNHLVDLLEELDIEVIDD